MLAPVYHQPDVFSIRGRLRSFPGSGSIFIHHTPHLMGVWRFQASASEEEEEDEEKVRGKREEVSGGG